jgi:uncharacterized protein YgbK (DUF1537 family)
VSDTSTGNGLVAFYGDDFTGSVDALLQFSRRGLQGRLFVGLPEPSELEAAAQDGDVVGVAGIARSLDADELVAEVAPVFDAFRRLAPRLVQYKACSTADSSPTVGSLGRVIEAGRAAFGDRPVPVVFAQPDFGRYTVFGHHFAAEGGKVYRLDRQPTMSAHPSTPMQESDLALHLGRQTTLAIENMPFTEYTSPSAVARRLSSSSAAAVVLDALDDDQLGLIGEALLTLPAPVFTLGSGGLSTAIAMTSSPRQPPADAPGVRGGGPVLAVSGSRSAQTRGQVDAARAAGWHAIPLAPGGTGEETSASVTELLASGRSVVLTSHDADLSGIPAADVLPAISEAAAGVVSAAVGAGATRRVVVCGGDTSSRVTRLLGVRSLSIAANPWGNVVLLLAHAAGSAVDGVELLLKGGQVGDDDLFENIRLLGS